MFDEDDFATSKLYFGTLQILRVFSSWIKETQKDLGGLVHYLKLCHPDLPEDITALVHRRDAEFKALLERIREMTEEVKALQDGVCIITSLSFLVSNLYTASFSMRLQCARLRKVLSRTGIFLSSLSLQ
jgi:hypothetical protein